MPHEVCLRRILQPAPAIVPTHSNERIGMSRSYDESMLEHATRTNLWIIMGAFKTTIAH